jgi:hypothetical protein
MSSSFSEPAALLHLLREGFLRVRLGVLGWAIGKGLTNLSSSSMSVPGMKS